MNASTAPVARKAALAFIFITVLMDVFAFGVIIPVLPHLVQQMVGGQHFHGRVVGGAAWLVTRHFTDAAHITPVIDPAADLNR